MATSSAFASGPQLVVEPLGLPSWTLHGEDGPLPRTWQRGSFYFSLWKFCKPHLWVAIYIEPPPFTEPQLGGTFGGLIAFLSVRSPATAIAQERFSKFR